MKNLRDEGLATGLWSEDIRSMSVAELKQTVEVLTEDERLELAEYLRWRSRKDDPQWQAEVGDRLNRCLAGQGTPGAQLQALHDKLSAEGR